jgi:hypothetical protein
MHYREKLQLWVREALGDLGGQGLILDVAKHVWANHETDLKNSDDAFYSWQYDIRWAANQMRRAGKLGLTTAGSKSIWVLKQ